MTTLLAMNTELKSEVKSEVNPEKANIKPEHHPDAKADVSESKAEPSTDKIEKLYPNIKCTAIKAMSNQFKLNAARDIAICSGIILLTLLVLNLIFKPDITEYPFRYECGKNHFDCKTNPEICAKNNCELCFGMEGKLACKTPAKFVHLTPTTPFMVFSILAAFFSISFLLVSGGYYLYYANDTGDYVDIVDDKVVDFKTGKNIEPLTQNQMVEILNKDLKNGICPMGWFSSLQLIICIIWAVGFVICILLMFAEGSKVGCSSSQIDCKYGKGCYEAKCSGCLTYENNIPKCETRYDFHKEFADSFFLFILGGFLQVMWWACKHDANEFKYDDAVLKAYKKFFKYAKMDMSPHKNKLEENHPYRA